MQNGILIRADEVGLGWMDGGGVKRAADATFAKSHGRGGIPLVVRVGPLRGYSSLQRPRGVICCFGPRTRGEKSFSFCEPFVRQILIPKREY